MYNKFMDVIEVNNLTKKFGKFTAVDAINFSLKEGEILGFLGPNGAGKTTTIHMLLGILTPTIGTISYFGKDLKTQRKEIMEYVNFSSTYVDLPLQLTVEENFNFISYLYKIPDRKNRIKKIVELFKLEELLHKQIMQLSAGQKTKVSLAKSFLNFPKVLLLDEPTASLDPETAKYVREFLLEEQKNFQVSIVLTSHNMSEVEEICDRTIFINHGKIIANDTPENLVKSINLCHVTLLLKKDEESLLRYCNEKKIPCQKDGKYYTVTIEEQDLVNFLSALHKQKIAFVEISIEKPSLEDYFLKHAGSTDKKTMEDVI